MAYRNPKMIMPALDDIVMQVLAMSEAQYEGAWIIGRSQYDARRPPGWPTAFVLLGFYGFPPSAAGWHEFVRLHIGVDVITSLAHRQMQGEERANRKWKLSDKPEYTSAFDEAYAAMWDSGMAVCADTFRRTGRMILR